MLRYGPNSAEGSGYGIQAAFPLEARVWPLSQTYGEPATGPSIGSDYDSALGDSGQVFVDGTAVH